MIQFKQCVFDKIREQVINYYCTNDILVESFWEDHVRESNCYEILLDDKVIGFLGIHGKHLISMFHIQDEYTCIAQEAFHEAKHLEEVMNAFAATGDEQMVSLCMDSFRSVEIQAYFTRDLNVSKAQGIVVHPSVKEDFDTIISLSKDFFGDEEKVKELIETGVIYLGYQDEKLVGFGAYEPGTIRTDLVSVGMFVLSELRRQGIGRNLLGAMKEVAIKNGKKAVSGCWYYNHNSLKTQFSCGNSCSTRLLKFSF